MYCKAALLFPLPIMLSTMFTIKIAPFMNIFKMAVLFSTFILCLYHSTGGAKSQGVLKISVRKFVIILIFEYHILDVETSIFYI